MPERIYTSSGDGKLEALEETPFPKEDDLQALIAKHPELLDGEQIRPGDARRWTLVTREKGIAPSAGEAARWSVDHLIIDQDAVPTLAEVKRGSNPEIRRTIVGQLLEYAAHASETWTAQELRGAFERQAEARDRDADAELAALLQTDEEPDVDGFWEDVSTTSLRIKGTNRSEQRRERGQSGGGGDEPLSGEGGEIVLNADGRCHEPRSDLPNGFAEEPRHQVKVTGKEVVRVLDFNPVRRDRSIRKVQQVGGDDHIATSRDCRGKDMTIVGVGKAERGDKRFVSGDQTIPRCFVHESSGAFQRRSTAVRFFSQQGIDPLPVDVAGPFRAKDILDRQLQENVPQRRGIEDVGVEKSGDARHRGPYPMSWV